MKINGEIFAQHFCSQMKMHKIWKFNSAVNGTSELNATK